MKYIILSKLVIATAIVISTAGCGIGSNSRAEDCSAEDFTDTCVELRMPQSTVVQTPALTLPPAVIIPTPGVQ